MASAGRESRGREAGVGLGFPWRDRERPRTGASNNAETERWEGTDSRSTVRRSIELRRKERRAAVDSARSTFYGQDNGSRPFVYTPGVEEGPLSRSTTRTTTTATTNSSSTPTEKSRSNYFSQNIPPIPLQLPHIPPKQYSATATYKQRRRTASSDLDAFPLPPSSDTLSSPLSPIFSGFSYNTTPMPPPTPPRPPGRSVNVVTLKEKLNRALTRRRDKMDLTRPPPAFAQHTEHRPGSNGESLPLTQTSTHSRSQSGVSTPPTAHSNPSPTLPNAPEGQYQFAGAGVAAKPVKSSAESDWVSTNWGTQDFTDDDYEEEDSYEEFELPIRPNSARAVRPMDTIEEEEAQKLNRRTAFRNLHNPINVKDQSSMPHSSSFETGMVLSSSAEFYGDSVDDVKALASFDFGLDNSNLTSSDRNSHCDEDGEPDEFGSNYVPSESEYDDCSPTASRNAAYNTILDDSQDYEELDSEDEDRQIGMHSSYFTDESLAAKALEAEERRRLAREFPSVTAYLKAQAQSSSARQLPVSNSQALSTADETADESLSFLEIITPSSESEVPSIDPNTIQITSGPNALTTGPAPSPANASSTVLGNPSLHSGNSSSQPSRLSSVNRSVTGSSSQASRIPLPHRNTSGSSSLPGFPARPGFQRTGTSASYMASIGSSEEEEMVARDLEATIRRLSKISANSSSNEASGGSGGISVVLVAQEGGGVVSRTSIRGSIEILSGAGGKSVTPRTPGSGGMISGGDGAGESGTDKKSERDEDSGSENSFQSQDVKVETSESDEEALLRAPRKLLPAQRVKEGVKIHPADERYDHVYRMRESTPDAQPLMVPVYNYSPTSAFPHRNALTAPQPAKIIDRYNQTSSVGIFELNGALHLSSGRNTMVSNKSGPLGAQRSPQIINPPLKLGGPTATEHRASQIYRESRLPGSRRDPMIPKIDSATLKRMQTTTSAKSAQGEHNELPKSPTIQTLHPALRQGESNNPFRWSTPKLRLPKSSHKYDEESGAYISLDPEVKLEQRRISKILFLLSCLFPPLLLVLAYGGFDSVVYELSGGRVPVADSVVKSAAKWVGWGLAVTIVAGVGGGVIGAVVVARAGVV